MSSRLNVLLVTDDAFAASGITAMLTRSGCNVVHVSSGEAGMTRMAVSQPDVLVVEWFLPDLDGTTMIREVRKRPGRQPGTILLSALSEPAARDYARKVGADSFLTRPVNEQLLRRALDACGPTSGISTSQTLPRLSEALRAIVGHPFWKRFDAEAARAISETTESEVSAASSPPSPSTPVSAQLAAFASMQEPTKQLEVQVSITCGRAVGADLALLILRRSAPTDAEISDLLGELSNVLLGRAKSAFRDAGFRFTASVPVVGVSTSMFIANHAVTLTGRSGLITVDLAVRSFDEGGRGRPQAPAGSS